VKDYGHRRKRCEGGSEFDVADVHKTGERSPKEVVIVKFPAIVGRMRTS